MPTPQLRTSGNREAYHTIGQNSGNVHPRRQYEHANALPTWYMGPIQWFRTLVDYDRPAGHASVCQHPTLTQLEITSRTTFSVY
jgi:hypothetical protein